MNDISDGTMPETKKFPPMNETMMVVPPTHREWKATQLKQINHFHVAPPFQHRPLTSMLSCEMLNMNGNGEDVDGDTVALTFKTKWDELTEASISIEDTLPLHSLMELAMVEGEEHGDLGVSACNVSDCRFLTQKKNGSKLTLK